MINIMEEAIRFIKRFVGYLSYGTLGFAIACFYEYYYNSLSVEILNVGYIWMLITIYLKIASK